MALEKPITSSSSQKRYTIAYALSSSKQKRLITSSLLSIASSQSLDLIPIDPSLPISSQCNNIHLILHKIYTNEWITNLKQFVAQNPSVVVIDDPDLIKKTQNRISMLDFVSNLETNFNLQVHNHHPCTLGVPKQITIENTTSLNDPTTVSNIKFPLIAKPFASDGSTGSHQMALVFNCKGLSNQIPPLVLQEFINHGGIIFKVYVIGDYIKCIKRKSLPDISNDLLEKYSQEGSISFSQISNTTIAQDGFYDEAEMPMDSFVNEIAQGLRSEMGLNLFNFDMIRDKKVLNHYLVIDINYFPGYEKLPGFEKALCDFLLCMVKKDEEKEEVLRDDLADGEVEKVT